MAVIIDSFEDTDFSEYSNDTDNYSRDGTRSQDGSYSAYTETGVNSVIANSIISTSGLSNYPSQGDVFHCWLYYDDSNGIPGVLFGVQDIDNLYFVRQSDNGGFSIFKRDAGSNTELAQEGAANENGQWLEFEVDWQSDGTISFDVKDTNGNSVDAGLPVTATDTTYTSGGIGLGFGQKAKNQSQCWFDAYTNESATSQVTVSVPVAQAPGTTPVPAVAGAGTATVGPPVAQAAGATPVPTVTGSGTAAVSAPVAGAAGATPVPTVTGSGTATASVPVAAATGSTPIPTVAGTGTATVGPPAAQGAGATPAPTVTGTGSVAVATPVAAATAATPVPSISTPILVGLPVAQATAATPGPTVAGTGTATVALPVAGASATTPVPTVTGRGATTVAAPVAQAAGATPAPGVTGSGTATVSVPAARATGATPVLTITLPATITAPATVRLTWDDSATRTLVWDDSATQTLTWDDSATIQLTMADNQLTQQTIPAAGENITRTFEIDEDGSDKDLSGASVEWYLLATPARDDADAVIDHDTTGVDLSITDAAAGELTLTVEQGVTDDLGGQYWQRLVVDDSGTGLQTWGGPFTIETV